MALRKHYLLLFGLLLIPVLLLSACGGKEAPAVSTPNAGAETTPEQVAATPTTVAPPVLQASEPTTAPPGETSAQVPASWRNYETRTAEGYYERGNPEAAILILDYSDFL
ncbi:MAG: hypothetical protein D6775_01600 [Caldilineae bacterium]|nr:MAG: hypothetical protein D6775_01600 [Caldilineae bacterium]